MAFAKPVVACLALMIQQAWAGNTKDCIKNTGGTCAYASCFSWRGPTDCKSNGLIKQCMCTGSTCAGGDGICTSTPYNNTGTAYRIKNSRWPGHYMDINANGGVSIDQTSTEEDDNRFTLKIPKYSPDATNSRQTNSDDPAMASCYLIFSVRWPDAVLLTQASGGRGNNKLAVGCFDVDGGPMAITEPSIWQLGIVLTRAPIAAGTEDPPVMISALSAPQHFFFVGQADFSGTVSTHHNDPGAGGYWYFEPRLPKDILDSLPAYRGQRCTSFCGTVASASLAIPGTSRSNMLLSAVVTMSILSLFPRA